MALIESATDSRLAAALPVITAKDSETKKYFIIATESVNKGFERQVVNLDHFIKSG